MHDNFQPMLAERKSVHEWHESLEFPVVVTPKLDGIRVCVIDGHAVTRKLLPVPNNYVRECLSNPEFNGLDGEVIVGFPNAPDCYNKSQCILGNKVKLPPFVFYVFDDFSFPEFPYMQRMERVICRVKWKKQEGLHFGLAHVCGLLHDDWESVGVTERVAVEDGYEGCILRAPLAPYKFGRSTKKEQGMLKLKRFMDGEAEIIGFEELQHNDNAAETDALGHTKRSSAAEGKRAGGTLGALHVRELDSGVEFRIGMFKGLTAGDKQELWDKQDFHIGRIVKYSSFKIGEKDKPRHAKFIGFREKADMS